MKDKYKQFVVYILLFMLSFTVAKYLIPVYKSFSITEFDPTKYDFNQENTEHQLVLVYIGSSTCGFSNEQTLVAGVNVLTNHVIEQAKKLGYSYSIIGLSKDRNINQGIDHLRKFDFFSEINTGNNWNSLGLNKFIWKEGLAKFSTPQILILEKDYVIREISGERTIVGIKNEELILKTSGLNSIIQLSKILPEFE